MCILSFCWFSFLSSVALVRLAVYWYLFARYVYAHFTPHSNRDVATIHNCTHSTLFYCDLAFAYALSFARSQKQRALLTTPAMRVFACIRLCTACVFAYSFAARMSLCSWIVMLGCVCVLRRIIGQNVQNIDLIHSEKGHIQSILIYAHQYNFVGQQEAQQRGERFSRSVDAGTIHMNTASYVFAPVNIWEYVRNSRWHISRRQDMQTKFQQS